MHCPLSPRELAHTSPVHPNPWHDTLCHHKPHYIFPQNSHHTYLQGISIAFPRYIAMHLHECSKYRKGVDPFDLYLASGLGTSPDKNPKETKCETLVDSCSQQPFFSFFPVPCLHANTIWKHSSHRQQELLHLLFFCCLC